MTRPPPPRPRARWSLLLLPALLLLASGCEEDPQPPTPPEPRYRATLQRTAYGIPHIISTTLGGVGFGQGYAFAQDNACILADQVVKVRGERARFLGAGTGDVHVASDFAYRSLDLLTRAQAAFDTQPADMKELLEGYAAGYNQYLRDTGVERLPGPCAGKPWVRPLTAVDLMAYHLNLALTASSFSLIPAIAAAQPPGAPGGQPLAPQSLEGLAALLHQDVGSNGWALGAERTQGGRGMVLANPHFPWEGELRLWESHLTVPGVMNVYGVSLMGVPGVLIGFNQNVAWTHTFSSGHRFTFYSLQLVPGSPTRYVYGNGQRDMTARAITLQVLQADGSLKDVSRTLYSSHYGPIVSLPGAGWTDRGALTYRDANLDNTTFITQFHYMNRARNLQAFQDAFATYQGSPWVNTLATNPQGDTWYADASATPNLSAATLQRWQEKLAANDPLTATVYRSLGRVLLDGSNPENEWVVENGARGPGLIPFGRVPQLSRRDFVFNANDSHWLANPFAPLEGFSPLQGQERVPQSQRTRMNATLLTEAREGGASGADGKFTLAELQGAILGNRSMTAELLRVPVVQRCTGKSTGTVGGQPVNITQACALLAAWNGRFDADSVGAIVWREFIGAHTEEQLKNKGPLFLEPFSPAAPILTPHTLAPAPATGEDPVLTRLAEAVVALGKAGVALDKPLAQVQFSPRAGQRIGLHGGQGRDGTANILSYADFKSTVDPLTPRGTVVNSRTGLTSEGYVVNNGTSFLMTLAFTAEGVDAAAMLTYGQSEQPGSPHFNDQLEPLYARKQWRKLLFSEEEIASDPGLTTQIVQGD